MDWFGPSEWPEDSGVARVSRTRLQNYVADTDKHIELQLADLGDITSLPIVYFDRAGATEARLVIRAPEGELIHPVGKYGHSQVMIPSRARGDRIKLQRIQGQWHVLSANCKLVNP